MKIKCFLKKEFSENFGGYKDPTFKTSGQKILEFLKPDKNGYVSQTIDVCANSLHLDYLFRMIDYDKGIAIEDFDFKYLYPPTHENFFNNSSFLNCKNISGLYCGNFRNTTFTNCHFKEFEIQNSSLSNLEFKNCEFEVSTICSNELNSIKIDKVPNSYDLTLDTDFHLPAWKMKNLSVRIVLDEKPLLTTEEKNQIKIEKVEDVFVVTSMPKKPKHALIDKIIDALSRSQISVFDGIDFDQYVFPEADYKLCSFIGCNLEGTFFEEGSQLENCNFNNALVLNSSLLEEEDIDLNLAIEDKNAYNKLFEIENFNELKGLKQMKNEIITEFSQDQLVTIKNYSTAVPAVANMCRKAVKQLLRFVLKKAGKTISMIANYVNVAMDLLESFKEEANLLFQLMIGYVCANLHKITDFVGDERSFMKFFSSKKIKTFGEFCLANGKGSVFASLLNRTMDFVEMFAGQLMSNPEVQRIVSVIENPETASRIEKIDNEFDAEAEMEAEKDLHAASVKKSRKHS